MSIETGQLLKPRQAALILNCHPQTIAALGRRGLLTEIRVGAMRRWRADEVAALARGERPAVARGEVVGVEVTETGALTLTA